ncbi:MAG TPA: radical SAM protein [Bryobacteraceae bacterium]|jgi:radical SAM protein with 4Fe4S-binding SPASM domain|nr:radical SAM protein [Bryobacteraceae bacterium]
MSSLMESLNRRALDAGIPLGVHIDLTWRCNERCIHCYLDHEDSAELTLDELCHLLDSLAEAGVFFLTLSGGEIFLRKDLEQIVAHARACSFDIKLKTNALLIGPEQAAWILRHGVHQVQVSIYSHRPEVHDGITKVRGSLDRSIAAIARLRALGVRVVIACVLMKQNTGDFEGVKQLAADLGAEFTLDPTITPHLNDYGSLLELNIPREDLVSLFHNQALTGSTDICLPPAPVDDDILDGTPCSAGHTSCYISPHGDVWPCVQFPLASGNVRESSFLDIWTGSVQLREVRGIRARDLTTCSGCGHVGTCSRCPGLAFMEGSMYGPSTTDCEKSFARTGIPSANMMKRSSASASRESLVHIQL